MGSAHASALAEGRIDGARLVAVCDPDRVARERFSDVVGFGDSNQLFASGLAEAVLIATPHWDHAPIAVRALEQGLHVLTEKPIAVHKADCEKMRRAYEERPNAAQVFAAMFSLRTDPRYLKLRELLEARELGVVQRINWISTDWFRPDAYYQSRPWRGSFRGEGGGVLLNQCSHVLDVWQWLFGMPKRVHAFCGFGRFHPIEVEDQVTAYLEYEAGATGVFVASTGEAPGTNRLEVTGDLGRVIVEARGLAVTRNEQSATLCSQRNPARNSAPRSSLSSIPLAPQPQPREFVIQNFVNAVASRVPLIAPAIEGIHSVELANAMVLSARLKETVTLPMDSARYAAELERLVASSR